MHNGCDERLLGRPTPRSVPVPDRDRVPHRWAMERGREMDALRRCSAWRQRVHSLLGQRSAIGRFDTSRAVPFLHPVGAWQQDESCLPVQQAEENWIMVAERDLGAIGKKFPGKRSVERKAKRIASVWATATPSARSSIRGGRFADGCRLERRRSDCAVLRSVRAVRQDNYRLSRPRFGFLSMRVTSNTRLIGSHARIPARGRAVFGARRPYPRT